jgi:hypothetical protein
MGKFYAYLGVGPINEQKTLVGSVFDRGGHTSLMLAVILSNYGRVLSILAAPCFFAAGAMARRRMV